MCGSTEEIFALSDGSPGTNSQCEPGRSGRAGVFQFASTRLKNLRLTSPGSSPSTGFSKLPAAIDGWSKAGAQAQALEIPVPDN